MNPPDLPPVAVTCGDPSGIGPEIAVAAWRKVDIPLFWIGDPRHLPWGTSFTEIDAPSEAASANDFPVLPIQFAALAQPGRPDPRNAVGVMAALAKAVECVQNGTASAMCTAPISKKELVDHGGFAFPGHTEYLADAAGGVPVVMMLASETLRVVPATIHIPLADVPRALSPELVETTVRITHAALQRDFGIVSPRLALAGLNPHAGEGGQIGTDEIDWIDVLADRLRSEGIRLSGPLSADTLFHTRARARYDAAIAMYHDQALIPIKTLAFDQGVNVTLGLPFVRTSPDHGTAFDIAGQRRANPTSMIEALRLAWQMAQARA